MRLLTRDQWGARPPRSVSTIPTPTGRLILHHGAIPGEGPDKVRSYQRYHMDARGYVDIAYSWMADSTYAYEGRGAGIAGAHTRGFNTDHAVCAVGDYSAIDPPDSLLDNLAALAVHAHQVGAVTQPAYTGGHRDYGTSSCPGDRLYAAIPEINRRAAGLAATPVREEDIMRQGDNGPRVAAWQHRLSWLGITATVDGDFGPKTVEATKQAQKMLGLGQDGEVHAAEWALLVATRAGNELTEHVRDDALHGAAVDLSGFASADHRHTGKVTVR